MTCFDASLTFVKHIPQLKNDLSTLRLETQYFIVLVFSCAAYHQNCVVLWHHTNT